MKDENHVRQTEGKFSFHCEGRNVHVHHVTINNYVIHGSESSPRQSPDAKNESKNKGWFQIKFSRNSFTIILLKSLRIKFEINNRARELRWRTAQEENYKCYKRAGFTLGKRLTLEQSNVPF